MEEITRMKGGMTWMKGGDEVDDKSRPMVIIRQLMEEFNEKSREFG